MSDTKITRLALPALALMALGGGNALGQVAQADQNGNIPASAMYPSQGLIASLPGPLFGFSLSSNKSGMGCGSPATETRAHPKVVATFPAEGAVVRPGVVVVRVTFDQPMSCDASFDGASDLPNPCPGRWREVTLSEDRRSFRTVCEVKANTRYRLVLKSFRNSRGLATPATTTFSTSDSAPIATIQQALAEDRGAGTISGG